MDISAILQTMHAIPAIHIANHAITLANLDALLATMDSFSPKHVLEPVNFAINHA
jgi:hypothetical protein